jgi:hypothetical protein
MKKIYFLAILLGCVGMAFADGANALPASLEDAIWEWGGTDTVMSTGHTYDTLIGDDSVKILTGWKPGNWDYHLGFGAFGGGDAATCTLGLVIKAKSNLDTLMYRVVPDTISSANTAGGVIPIPISSYPAQKYDIWLKQIGTTTGDTVVINELYLAKRRPVVYGKQYDMKVK